MDSSTLFEASENIFLFVLNSSFVSFGVFVYVYFFDVAR